MGYESPNIADLLMATLFSARSTKIYRDILREQAFKKKETRKAWRWLCRACGKKDVQTDRDAVGT